jgi:peptide chain release factor 2
MKKELQKQAAELKERLDRLTKKLSPSQKKERIIALEKEVSKPDLWENREEAERLLRELGDLKSDTDQIRQTEEKLNSLLSLIKTTKDKAADDLAFIERELRDLTREVDKLELRTFLSGPFDTSDAILSIHAGQGGTEACDWAQMLMRMYLRFCEKKGWKTDIVDERPGEEAGIKSVTFFVKGRLAYGWLKGEKGTHRLVRLSPFNANNLRQTSFAQVEVMPIFTQDQEVVEIKPQDLEISFSRSSGHGGQNVNKVSTAVRIRHIPTDIVVECQTQRYQEQNRKIALQILQGKLWELRQTEQEKKEQSIKGEYKIAGWGNQIRSYVLQPYKLVKDLRTGWEETNPDAVLDGELDGFLKAQMTSPAD